MVGISFDQPADNKAFAEAQGFGFALLSDVDKRVGAAYEVLREPDDKFAGFSQRLSYLIAPDGVIRRSYVVSDAGGHAEVVLGDLADLRG